ncbi:MAG: carboxypeptidase-like regulatory domain-containing protein, partial [Planctomycetota bacterium]
MTRGGLFLLLVAALAAGAVGYLAGSADDESAPDLIGGEREAPEAPRETPKPLPPAPSGGFKSLADALASISAPDVEAGEGMITGTVKNHTGEPMADVLVRAERTPDSGRPAWQSSGAPPEEKDLVDDVREYVEKRLERESLRRETRTGEDGRYALTGLADKNHTVTAYKKGWRIAATQGSRGYRVKPGDQVDFTASPLVGIPVVVLLPDGSEPEKAWISAKTGQWPRTVEWRPDQREVWYAPGKYTLSATAGDDREMKSEE